MSEADNGRGGGAVLLMSVPLQPRTGPVATWITAAGWASAARRVLGRAWLVSPQGVLDPGRARVMATQPPPPRSTRRSTRPWIPAPAKTLAKDVRDAVRARRFRRQGLEGPWNGCTVRLVWQRHDLFQSAGLVAARRFGCPLVLFVDAPVVWEARRWGVDRPGWGRLVEALGEKPMLRRADLVACVSDEVADQVRSMGAAPERVIVTPCSVDAEVFHTGVDGTEVRKRYELGDRFVIGWTGSFRRFHGLEVLLEAFVSLEREVPEAILFLVGDGAERERLEGLARAKGVAGKVVFSGTVPHDEMPGHVAAMDVAVLTAPGDAGFHYSPLKLKEYMACGRAIVAPRVGQVPSTLAPEGEGLLVEPGDPGELAAALRELHGDPGRRSALGAAAERRVQTEGIWDQQMNKALDRLSALGSG